MNARIDISGQKFGKLTIVSRHPKPNTQRAPRWVCACECGGTTVTTSGHLRSGHTASCGCSQKEKASQANQTHGLSGLPEYLVWEAMKKRCSNEKQRDFKYYGGRGISVCDRWQDFLSFYEDMGPRPSPQHSIDRSDNDGNYEPGNCRWVTRDVQLANRRPYQPRAVV